MPHDELNIECDEPGWAVLRVQRAGGNTDQGWLQVLDFAIDDVAEALLATGWVHRNADGRLVSAGKDCQALCDVVSEMFTYFARRNEPRPELLRVRDAVAEYELARELAPAISLWAFAWLDLMVREDLADEARSTRDVWEQRPLPLHVQEHCDRRVKELLARFQGASTAGRMAHSRPSRSASADAKNRAG